MDLGLIFTHPITHSVHQFNQWFILCFHRNAEARGARRTSLRKFGLGLQETSLASIENLCNISAIDMATVTISPKFQVVIPKDVRDGLALSPGDKVEVIQLEGRIEIVPVKPIESLRGFLKGLTNTFEREGDRCLS